MKHMPYDIRLAVEMKRLAQQRKQSLCLLLDPRLEQQRIHIRYATYYYDRYDRIRIADGCYRVKRQPGAD
jgi:hypothetical protein